MGFSTEETIGPALLTPRAVRLYKMCFFLLVDGRIIKSSKCWRYSGAEVGTS